MQDLSDNQPLLSNMEATLLALCSAQHNGLVPLKIQQVDKALLDAWYAQVPPITPHNMTKDALIAMKRIPWNNSKYCSDLEDIVYVYIWNKEKPPSLPTPHLLNTVPLPSPLQSTSALRLSKLTSPSPLPSIAPPTSSTLLNPDPLLAILREHAASARSDATTKRNKARVADLKATISKHKARAYEKAALENNIDFTQRQDHPDAHLRS
ncbi:hypothetical protein PHLCEN_2v1137 [Hermanssonia centrifuga]|uniref:Uncharacterized protein n=1 Tax=Hermanssonia centrifuga TaxID=98765 RepID=A0A2R6S405_9APHY|nr:hypothetical protein PHLCEN_2v1137 [Hermanssonia centrifuga]